MKPYHLILDFTHVYDDEICADREQFSWIDCSDIEGSDLYCSPQAEREIRRKIEPYGLHGIHFVDSGNYHYVTKIFTDQIHRPFSLIVFDHHTDMQQPLMEGMMSCGDWAGMVLDQNPALQQFILIGPAEDDIKQIRTKHLDKLITFSAEEIRKGEGVERLKRIHGGVPLYISIDKDVLSEQYSETNWNQGELTLGMLGKVFGVAFFVYLFFGFMLLPCLNTITQIFTTTDSAGNIDPLAVIRFFFAGNMPSYVLNSLKLAVCLVITVNIVGISIVLLTEYFDIKGAKILRLGYMTTLIYSGVALVTGYLFLYDSDGIMTTWLSGIFPNMDKNWFSGFNAVLFTMTFACTSNHALFLRNAIRAIDYNTVEAARNLGAKPFKVLLKVVFPTLIPTLFSLTVMTFITGLCAMSAPTLLGYDSINPEIVRLAGSSSADEAFPQARAALLSIILAMFTIILLTVLSSYERKGHYLSVSKTKAKLVKQKISNPVANVLAHIYAYVLFIIYMTPVVMIVLFAFQNYPAIRSKTLSMDQFTLINFFGQQDYEFLTNRGKLKTRTGAISGLFANADTVGGIRLSFVLSAIAAALACVIVVVAVNYIFKNKGKKRGTVLEYSLLFPWLLPTILICYSYRTYFNSDSVWYVFNNNLYMRENVRFLIVMAYTVVKLPFALRMIKAAFYAIDEELEDAARNLGASSLVTFLRVTLPSVLAVFALNFNALFTEYDMSATFQSSYGKTYAMIIQNMCAEEGRDGYNVNASGRRCASTVFIMVISGLILYLVYGVGARDLGERIERREKRRKRIEAFKAKFTGKKKAAEKAAA